MVDGKRRGPQKVRHESINLLLAAGDKALFDSVLRDGETRLDMIRGAIYAEVERRKAEAGSIKPSAS